MGPGAGLVALPFAVSNPWWSWDYVTANAPALLAAGREHVGITVAAMAIACTVAVPLTLLVRRVPRLTAPVLSAATVAYTIPSLALISMLWPVFGVQAWTVVVALALYALLILIRGMVVGLAGADAATVDAAIGMGMDDAGLLWRVQVPLAVPSIIAALRIATVSTVGMVTVGALVGHGGFGSVILAGLNENFYHAKIAAGTVGAVGLSLLADALLRLIERRATVHLRPSTAVPDGRVEA